MPLVLAIDILVGKIVPCLNYLGSFGAYKTLFLHTENATPIVIEKPG